MNFKKLISSAALLAIVSTMIGSTGCVVYNRPYTNCYYDYWGYYVCDTYYYNGDGTTETSRDMITDIAQADEQLVQSQAKHYAEKFSLSEEQGLKIAKTLRDFGDVKNRSESDIADFAQRLYGVSPTQIVAAAGKAQAGDNTELNALVDEAAKNFNTTSGNMKSIVKDLHGKLLEQQGIRF